MNPDPQVIEFWAAVHAREDRIRSEERARLHNAAIKRRRKAKRGGRK